ncbi:hypothetical protein F5Y13DRAFT_200449 [Hypoxylon sp. FL1857]|nr:hypothetical protein F5Y13DRAFT_200449 [Hypoxylon sp. FL1857]
MDPFAALGAASAIATFIQMGFKLVSNAHEAYSSVTGMPRADEQLRFVVEQLEALSKSMISTKPTLELGDAERAMETVAEKCILLSKKLVEILNRSQTKDPHSLRQSAVAAFQSKWRENEKKEVKKELDDYAAQSSKAINKLASMNRSISNEVAALRRHIALLEDGVILSSIGKEAADQLANIFQLSSSALDATRSHQILESLSFPETHQRYATTGRAFSETFEWIFEDNPDKSLKALDGKTLFTNWLQYGHGIFHVAGKPGSGKSTLMKFLCKHKKTKSILDSWAAGRQLITGKHFFWHPGKYMEKSITGLLRTLLYDVLQQCVDLVPHVFPQQWVYLKGLPWHASVEHRFEDNDLKDAFNRLIENRNLFKDRCFFFMIDGLDEFQETRDEWYKQLIELLFSWIRKAPTDIKLCVSSREHAVFLDHFDGIQSLKLQDLTADDIHRYVKAKLGENPNFQRLTKPYDGEERLISRVEEMANGVFLWVSLVVKLLDDACDDEDTFEELERKIEFLPCEVEDLFRQLFNSIHESDKDQSAQTFAIALKLLANGRGLQLSLFRYSLLDDYNADAFLVSKPDFLSHKLFTEDEEAMKARLKRARKQLQKRCKGLLEVIEADRDWGSLKGTNLTQRISLVHRSIQEYLTKETISKEIIARTKGFDVVGAICQTYVAEVVALNLEQPGVDKISYVFDLVDVLYGFSKIDPDILERKWISSLYNLHRANIRSLQLHLHLHTMSNSIALPEFVPSIAHSVAFYGIHKFFTTWNESSACPINEDIKNGSLVLAIILAMCPLHKLTKVEMRNLLIILRWLFEHGCSPNQAILLVISRDNDLSDSASLWWAFLYNAILTAGSSVEPMYFEATQVFLEFGANPDISFFSIEDEHHNEGGGVIHTVLPTPTGVPTVRFFLEIAKNIRSRIMPVARPVSLGGGQATLREVIQHMNPPNVESLLSLIDRNLQKQQVNPNCSPENQSSAHTLPSVKQDIVPNVVVNDATDYEVESASVEGILDPSHVKGYAESEMIGIFRRTIATPLVAFASGVLLAYVLFLFTRGH